MHVLGRFYNADLDIYGRLFVTFEVYDKQKALHEIEPINGLKQLVIDVKKYREKRSLDANRYFWKLVDGIAKASESDKETEYINLIKKYGVFEDVFVPEKSIHILQKSFKCIDDLYHKKGYAAVRCYLGSSEYDSKQMADLINGTVRDAQEWGVETLTPAEIKHLLDDWKGE